jgi:hypothetical protein
MVFGQHEDGQLRISALGLLERAQLGHGRIVVVEAEDLRSLVLDGVAHAAGVGHRAGLVRRRHSGEERAARLLGSQIDPEDALHGPGSSSCRDRADAEGDGAVCRAARRRGSK